MRNSLLFKRRPFTIDNLEMVCQEPILTREPNPVEIRIEEYFDSVKDGEILERIYGSKKVLKKIREIERRRSRNKIDSQSFQKYVKGGTKTY